MSTADITRDMVITAANGLRVVDLTDAASTQLDATLRDIVTRGAGIAAGEVIERFTAYPANAGDDADGLLIDAWIRGAGGVTSRSCTITTFAATDAALSLTGSVALKGAPIDSSAAPTTLRATALSGPVFTTAPIDTADYGVLAVEVVGAATDAGSSSTTRQEPQPKSQAQRDAARTTYDRAVAAAKKSYKKALKKAGSNKRKKKTAKQAYSAKKAAAKAQYAAALVDDQRTVTVTVPVAGTLSRPFALSISTDFTG